MSDQYILITGSKGVNLFVEPKALGDDELASCENAVPEKPGTFSKRKTALCLIPRLVEVLRDNHADVPLAVYMLDANGDALRGILAHSYDGDMMLTAFDPDNGATPVNSQLVGFTGDGFDSAPVFMQFVKGVGDAGQNVYVFPGNTSPNWRSIPFEPESGGTAGMWFFAIDAQDWGWQEWIDVSNDDLAPLGGCVYLDRCVYWNLAVGFENAILFSDRNEPAKVGIDALAANGRWLQIGGMLSGPVMGCLTLMLTESGTPATSGVLVLSRRGSHLVTGEPNQSTDPAPVLPATIFDNLQVNKHNAQSSCVSFASAVQTPYGIFWVGDDDVWCFNGGSVPFQVGTKLRPLLKTQPTNVQWKIHAAYFNGFYRVALFANDSGYDEFSKPEQQWWLDLRAGAPSNASEARWFGPHGYLFVEALEETVTPGTYCMGLDNIPVPPRLMSAVPTVVPDVGLLYFMSLVNLEGQFCTDESTSEFPINDSLGSTFPLVRLETKQYAGAGKNADQFIDKIYTGVELMLRPSVDMTFQTVASLDRGPEGMLQVSNDELIDSTSNEPDVLQSTYTEQLVYPDANLRYLGKLIQLSMGDLRGYTIATDDPAFTFTFTEEDSPITIALGELHYANLVELLDALCAAMTAGSLTYGHGGTYTHNQLAPPFTAAVVITSVEAYNFAFGVEPPSYQLAYMLDLPLPETYSPAPTLTGNGPVPYCPASQFEVGGIVLRVCPINRRLA